MSGKGFVRQISIILAVALMVTSVPVNTYATPINENVGSEIVEVENSLEDDDVLTESVVDGTESVGDYSNEATDDEISEATNNTDKMELLEEESAEEELVSEEKIINEEALAEAATEMLTIDSDTADKSGNGWNWVAETGTLTLNGAYLRTLTIKRNVNIVVTGDSTIDNAYSGYIFHVIGENATEINISGSGTLTLNGIAQDTLSVEKEYNPVVTISGNTLTVDCKNSFSTSGRYAINVGGTLNVKDGATVKATSLKGNPISCPGVLNITTGGKIVCTNPDDEYSVNMADASSINIRGEESALISNKTEGTSNYNGAIGYYGNITTSVNIINGGKLVANDVKTTTPASIIKAVNVDITGGVVEAHAKAGESFAAETVMVTATGTLNYEAEGLKNSACADNKNITITNAASDWMYVNADPQIIFNTKPESEIGVKTGETKTLTVDAALLNTIETPTISYQWYKDGAAISGATNTSYSLPTDLSEGTYSYSCKASATLSSEEVIKAEAVVKVVVNRWGLAHSDVELIITESLATTSNEAQGWSWNKETKTLTLDNAFLKSIKIKCDATINVLSDSMVSSNDSHAIYVDLYVSDVVIQGDGTLTLETVGNNISTIKNESDSTVTIKGENLVVDCIANTKNIAAINASGGLVVTDNATLNVSSKQSAAIKCCNNLTFSNGAKVNLYVEGDFDAIDIVANANINISGRGTVLTTDRVAGTKGNALDTHAKYSAFKLDDHAKLVLKNCYTGYGYVPMNLCYAEVSLGNARINIYASNGSFAADRIMVNSLSNKITCIEDGLNNTKKDDYGHLLCETAASSWKYIGDQPYLEFTTNPAEKSAVKAGENIELTVAAELKESEDTPNISYQWYLDGQAVAGATSATSAIITAGLAKGPHKLYCKATMTTSEIGEIEKDSAEFTVYITEDGSMPRIEKLNLTNADTSKDESQGWNWDNASKTLTLDNYMQYLEGDAIVLPAKSTVILKGENLIQTKNGIPIQCNGDLLVYGTGNINLNREVSGTNFAVYTTGKLTIGGGLSKGTRDDRTNYQALKQALNEGTGLYEARIEGNDTPFIYFDETSSDIVFTSTVGGEKPSIKVGARLVNTETGSACTYQWYVTSDWENPESASEAISGATSSEYKAPVTERGGKYYYCKITASDNDNTYTEYSDIYCVVVGASGVNPITSIQTIGNTDIDKWAEYGWKYTAPTEEQPGILTLKNVEGFIPFAGTGNAVSVFDFTGNGNIKIVLEENSVNNFSGSCGAFHIARTGIDSFEITGNGTLEYYDSVKEIGLFSFYTEGIGSLVVSDGANVIEKDGHSGFKGETNIVVDDASLSLCNSASQLGMIKVINGGKLKTTSNNTIKCKGITVDKDSDMRVKYTNPNGSAVTVTDAQGRISVGGTLLINALNANTLSIKANSERDSLERIELTDGASVLSPIGKTMEELYEKYWGGYDVYGKDELLIAQSSFSRTAITGATGIIGEMSAGSTVQAGDITPADATVIYQWQYAESDKSADALWTNIDNANSKTYTINDDKLIGKYLRVKITGTTNYYGTVYSKSTTPVAAVGATMVDFMADGFSLGRYSGDSTLRLSYADGVLPDEVAISVLTQDPSATVVIENITEGFDEKTEEEKTINGASGMMPVHYSESNGWNYNTIKVSITSGETTKEYRVKLETLVNETKITIKAASDQLVMILNENMDIEHPLAVVEDDTKEYAATAGNTYTIIAKSLKDGRYLTSFGNSSSSAYYDQYAQINDEDEYRYVTFKMPFGQSLLFDITGAKERVYAPQVSAQWEIDENENYYIIAEWDVSERSVKYDPAKYTGDYFASLFDESGNEINLDGDSGFYDYDDLNGKGIIYKVDAKGNEESLDPTQSYTLKVWRDVDVMSKLDVQEITIDAISVDMSEHHVVIERPENTPSETLVPINSTAKVYKIKQIPGTDTGVVVETSGNELKITVQPTAELGTVYAMVYQMAPTGKVVSDVAVIDIVQKAENVYVGLSETKGTLDIYKNGSLEIPINTTNTAANITGVSFVESSNPQLSDKFEIKANELVNGSRTLEVTPKNLPDAAADNVDWANVVKGYKGTFKAKLKFVFENDANEYITTDVYTMTIGGKAPAVKVGAVKFNSFYQGEKAAVSITSNSGKVISAVVDTSKNTAKTVACPQWAMLEDDGFAVSLINEKLVNKKGSGKIYLNAVIDGYRIPAQVVVAVSAAYSAPKVKLSESTITVPNDASMYSANGAKRLSITSTVKNVSIESLNITKVRVASSFDFAQMSEKDKKAYDASKYFKVTNFKSADGSFNIEKSGEGISEFIAGKVLLIATLGGNSGQEIMLPLTVKVLDVSKITIKSDKTAVSINSFMDNTTNNSYGAQKATVHIVPSAAGIDLVKTDDYTPITWTVTDGRGNGDYSSSLSIASIAYSCGGFEIGTNSNTTEGVYLVNFSVQGIAKPATVKVTVKGSVPSIKLSKSTVILDRYLGIKNDTYAKTSVGIKLSDDTISRKGSDFSYIVLDSQKNEVSDAIYLGFNSEGTNVDISLDDEVKTGTYTVEMTYTMPSGKQAKAKETVKVTAKAPAIKADKKAIKLNADLGNMDVSTVKITYADGYSYGGSEVKVYDSSNNLAGIAVGTSYNNTTGILSLYAKDSAVKGATYKVYFTRLFSAYGEVGKATTVINVSIPKADRSGKTTIKQTLKSKGTIDLSREDSKMQVLATYTGWNGAISSDIYPGDVLPAVKWKVYAYDKSNKPYYCDEHASWQKADGNGLVAEGYAYYDDIEEDYVYYEATAKDWFINVDPNVYGVTLKPNPSSNAIQQLTADEGFYNLTYKLVYTTSFDGYEDVVSEMKFKLTSGTVKLAAIPNAITLDRNNKYDSKVIKVQLKDKDAMDIKIAQVFLGENSVYDASLLYVGGGYAYVAIGWKDDVVPVTLKSGNQTLSVYAGYNCKDRTKANGTVTVKVNVK